MTCVSEFTIKNERRKAGRKKVEAADFRYARSLRREQPNGAFGNASDHLYNECVKGTSGVRRG